MRRVLLAAALGLASCNAINGFSDLEKVECVKSCEPPFDASVEASPDGSPDVAVEIDSGADTFLKVDDTATDIAPETDGGALADASDAEVASDVADTADTGCVAGSSRSCYTGPSSTAGKGACHSGLQHCLEGAYGPCLGQIVPTSETCNGIDDDCNGTVDDGAELGNVTCGVGACKVTKPACVGGVPAACTPTAALPELCDGIDNDCDGAIDEDGCSCVNVAPTGLDTNDGTTLAPMRTINAAIGKALTGSKRVCVASGATCPSTSDYAEAVVMKNGVSVYGGYQATGTIWPRTVGCTSRIIAQNARGVYFDVAVTTPTILDGFTVTGRNDPTNAGITIEGSIGAVVNNVVVLGGSGATSIGIDVLESGETRATPTISRSAVSGGTGAALAIGLRATRSSPIVQDNCTSFDTAGRCNVADPCAAALFIRGRSSASTSARSYGIFLSDAPRAIVTRSAVCSGGASTETHGVRLAGDLTLLRVSNSSIHAMSSLASAGAYIDGCADGAPSLFNNFAISGESTVASSRSEGVWVNGTCHARIDSNVSIVGNDAATPGSGSGVVCAQAAVGKSSRCSIANNGSIVGTETGTAASVIGVRCEDGACSRIERNARIAGTISAASVSTGVTLSASGTFVAGNVIESGCATVKGIALSAADAFARIENNVLRGSSCATAIKESFALRVIAGPGRNEVDVHSNTLFGLGSAGSCYSSALLLEPVFGTTPGPRGLFRNLILVAGACSLSYAVTESGGFGDPRVFQNNDLWPLTATALYRDEGGSGLTTIAQVNALKDGLFSGSIAGDPGFISGYKLSATSTCRDVGTMDGAPALDIDLDPRPIGAGFDIGADEQKP